MNLRHLVRLLGIFYMTYSGVLAAPKCSKDNLDIFIVLDGSQSIYDVNFERLRNFLSNLVGHFKIGEFESRVGLMQFSNTFRTVIEFDFGKHKTTKDVQENIRKLIHQYGNQTYAGNALKLVNKHVFPGNRSSSDRPDSEKVLLLITDGQPHDPDVALEEAAKLKEKGVHLITIGAGTQKWINRFKLLLNRIGSKPTQNHQQDFKYLERMTHKLVRDICGSKERQPAPPHKCFQEKQDIVIMMDGSKSIGKRNFYKIKLFLQDFLSRVDVGQSRLHVSVVQFSDTHTITVEVGLNQYTSVEDVVAAVAKIMYQGGKEADLFSALRRVNLMVLNGGYGDRVTAPDTVIIFTNGNFNNEGVPEVLGNLREKKVRIVGVGVGSSKDKDFNQEKIDALAIGTGDVYDLANLKSSVFIDDIAPSTCKMTSCTSAAPKCTPESQDIMFLMDGSVNIGSAAFRQGQKFIKRLVQKMTVGKNTTHVGVMQYGSAGRVTHASRLNTDNLRSLVMDQISRMVYMDERRDSDLAYALSIASDRLLNPRKEEGRGSVSKTIVIITDGDIPDFSEVNSIAETLRNRGIRIIALSNGVNSKYKTYVSSLRLIASGPKEYYRVENAQFNEILAELQKTVCISKPQIPETCFTQKRRVFFVLDSSPGRNRKKFKEVKEFMENMVTKLQIGLSNSQVGFLQYDDHTTARNRVVFEKDDTVEKILWRIQNMKYRKGKESYLGNALRIVNSEVFRSTDGNREYKDLLIIVAHREIQDAQLAFDEAEKLKDKGVEIISVATGKRHMVGNIKSQLQVISTTQTNTHSADYTSLWTILDEVLVNVCGLGQCTSFMATTCTPKKQDVAFVIDSSRSIGEFNYRRLQRFTRRLASRLDLGKGRTHLGVLQAGGRKGSRFQFNIGDFPDRSDIFYMINDMKYLDSKYTYMGEALKRIREKVFNNNGSDRPDIPNTLVIFADGQSHDPGEMLKEAELLKKMGVNILSVGYGVNVTKKIEGMKNLRTMATNHKDVFSIDFKNNDLVLEEKIEVIAKHLVQVDCPRAFAPPVQCIQGAVDLFLLVDGSRSITPHNFKFVKKFLRKLTSEFEVNDKEAHVGLLQFSDEKSMSYEFALNEMHSNKQVRRAIKRMRYRAGSTTNTGDALRIVNRYVFNGRNGDRPEAADVLIVFTDGQAHDFKIAQRHADEMKKRNIKIITIAAGPGAKNPKAKLVKQMEAIASDPLNVYRVDFSELNDIVDRLIDIDCYVVPAARQN